VVRADGPEILSLEELAPAICDPGYTAQASFSVLEHRLPGKKRMRSKLLKTAQKIREFIKNEFLAGKTVELQKVAKKFKRFNLSLACFCNHVRWVREELEGEGYLVIKTGGGKYVLE